MDTQPDIRKNIKLPMPKGNNTALMLKSAFVQLIFQMYQAWANTTYWIKQTDGTNVLPAIRTLVARMTPSQLDCPVP